MRSKIKGLLVYLLLSGTLLLKSQTIDSVSFRIYSRYNYLSNERMAEIILEVPSPLRNSELNITFSSADSDLHEWKGRVSGDKMSFVFVSRSLKTGNINAEISSASVNQVKYTARCDIVVLPHKTNEVKIDRLTDGLIVGGKKYFPFGFYCYSPVHKTLPEEEAVNGFNLISPYQKLLPESLPERKAYMDRCAQLGMKVHYNLLSVSGGGGVNSKIEGITDEEKRKLLVDEIRTFMDHPALLAWYISDEPNGRKVSPETLEQTYRLIKEIDPWHPVSVVFMTPFSTAKNYADCFDIVMADPYPVPDFPVSMVRDATSLLKKEFSGKKPVWIVPQAFGGGELWSREPSVQEIRSMTWQAIINGATGIQYFIRNGLNSFPKSTATWGECGRMALEIQSIAPWLLSEEKSIAVKADLKNISVTSRLFRGQLLIMAVNVKNEPLRAGIIIDKYLNMKAQVLFENRYVTVRGGVFYDYLPAYGSMTYMIDLDPPPASVKPWTGNLIVDPGFEDITSPGIPASCYIRPGNDRGATCFLDPAEQVEGNYSMRLLTPADNAGLTIRFFPVKVKTGSSYLVSLWAKLDRMNIYEKEERPSQCYVEIGLGEFGKSGFTPQNEWKQFVTIVTIPPDTVPEKKANVILRMPGKGVAWFDMLQVIEDPLKKN